MPVPTERRETMTETTVARQSPGAVAVIDRNPNRVLTVSADTSNGGSGGDPGDRPSINPDAFAGLAPRQRTPAASGGGIPPLPPSRPAVPGGENEDNPPEGEPDEMSVTPPAARGSERWWERIPGVVGFINIFRGKPVENQNIDQSPADEPEPAAQEIRRPSTRRGRERGGSIERSLAEIETSPERGRFLVEEIVQMETAMSYEVRYNAENGPRLNKLYKDLQEYVEAICAARNDRDPWDPAKVYGIQPHQPGVMPAVSPDLAQPLNNTNQLPAVETPRTPEDLTGLASIGELTAAYTALNTPREQLPEIERQLLTYFKEADRVGLFKGVNGILTDIRDIIRTNPSRDRAWDIMEQRLAQAGRTAETTFRNRRSDPEIARLMGIWEPYINWARERFELALIGAEQPPYREGEFRLNEQRVVTGETHWRPSTYPETYIVDARNPTQFRTATRTFMEMIKSGDLGRNPDVIITHLENFKKALGQQGSMEIAAQAELNIPESDKLTHAFMEELRLEFEAVSYVFGADYNNESYNLKGWQQYEMAMALHEGPARHAALIRANDGEVAPYVYMFDYDPVATLLHNPCGSRGQLGNDTVTQHYLHMGTRQIMIERGMGVMVKDYDPRDDNPSPIRSDEARKANVGRIGIHKSQEEFRGLYEGLGRDDDHFVVGNAHKANYEKFKHLDQEVLQNLPDALRGSIELGRIQQELEGIRTRVNNGQLVLGKGKDAVSELSSRDQKIYKAALGQAETNFDIAFQMVGAMGEKARRGGATFYIERNPHIQVYQELEGVPEKNLSDGQKRSIKIAKMLLDLRDRKRFETFTDKEQAFFNGLSKEDKADTFDYMPVYIAEKFVQMVETKTKIEYADESDVWKDLGFYEGTLYIINSKGQREKVTQKAQYRTYMVAQARKAAIGQIKKNGYQAKLEVNVVKFDEEGYVVGVEPGKKEVIDIETAEHHIYSRWTSHSYWGYQPENRHMLLQPRIFEAARRIRAGKSRPEDEDPLATQLLIVDPTLDRIDSLPHEAEREGVILMAAVEESYQGHWRINRELYKAFLPADGNARKIRVGYNQEDYGGISRFIIGIKALTASQPKRFARRFAAHTADMPMEMSSEPDILGQEGVMGVCSMHADLINRIAGQRIAGQFAITKYIDQMVLGGMLHDALLGDVSKEKGLDEEGVYEKPLASSTKLHGYYAKINSLTTPENYVAFAYAWKDTLSRIDKALKIIRVMASSVRNAQGALWLENTDVFLEDGRFNPVIDTEADTGTSRHSERIFWNSTMDWFKELAGGLASYSMEKYFIQFLHQPFIYTETDSTNPKKIKYKRAVSSRTLADWLFDQMGR